MLVEVTQEHIDKGLCKSPVRCALALALKEKLNRDDIMVADVYCHIGGPTFVLKQSAVDFVKAFDKGLAKPCSVEIDDDSQSYLITY